MEMYYNCSSGEKSAEKFHKACDKKGATITLFHYDQCSKLYGGYTSISWQSPSKDKYKKDENAFLFSIDVYEKPGKILELKPNKINSAVCHNKHKGPCFGEGDLWIKYQLYYPDAAGWNDPSTWMEWKVHLFDNSGRNEMVCHLN